MLFSADFYPTQEEAIAQLGQYFQSPEEDDVDESGILQVLHKVELKETDSEYLQARTANIMEKIPEIDEKLNQAAAGWKTKRMGKVELTILRLALYEMIYDDAIPEKVSINEAVELAKKFGGNDSPSFVNGILAKFVSKGTKAAGENRAAEETQDLQASQDVQASQDTKASQTSQDTKAPQTSQDTKAPQDSKASQGPADNKESEA